MTTQQNHNSDYDHCSIILNLICVYKSVEIMLSERNMGPGITQTLLLIVSVKTIIFDTVLRVDLLTSSDNGIDFFVTFKIYR